MFSLSFCTTCTGTKGKARLEYRTLFSRADKPSSGGVAQQQGKRGESSFRLDFALSTLGYVISLSA